jgi:hypothetical protein
MVAVVTDLLIGSYPNLSAQSLTITVGATVEVIVLPAGSYYFRDGTASLSLLAALETAINAHSLIAGATVVLQRDLKVFISGNGTAFALTWPVDNQLRDMIGATGNLVSATTHTMPNQSRLVWSAGKRGRFTSRLGTDGTPVHDTATGQAATGVVTSASHNTYRSNSVTWRYVRNARVWTTSEAAGEYFAFWDAVLRHSRRFKVYRDTTEDPASTTAITYGTLLPSTRAYVHVPPPPVVFPYGREFEFIESLHPIAIDPITTSPEYT